MRRIESPLVMTTWAWCSSRSTVAFGAAGALSARTGAWAGSAASATLPAVFVSEAAHEAITSGDVGWIVLVIVIAAATTLWLLWRADRTSVQRTMLCLAAWTALGVVAYLPFG